MKAIIAKKEPVAKLTQYTELDLQGDQVDFEPGQYFFITLRPQDRANREELTHHFSIVNSPEQRGILSFTTRLRLDSSLFKRSLHESRVGDEVEIGDIEGDFVLPQEAGRPLIFIALGIGITPYMSMLRHIFETGRNDRVTLIYTDNEIESMPFLDELQKLDREHENFKLITSVTGQDSSSGENRHIDTQFITDYLKDITANLYYVSGPPKAVQGVTKSFTDGGIPVENIKSDNFDGY
jgi:ferredoxin-NADP reductase